MTRAPRCSTASTISERCAFTSASGVLLMLTIMTNLRTATSGRRRPWRGMRYRSRAMGRLVGSVLVVGLLGGGGLAWGQPRQEPTQAEVDEARFSFETGRARYEQGDWEGALSSFQ